MTLIPISGEIIKNHSRYGQTNFELTVEFKLMCFTKAKKVSLKRNTPLISTKPQQYKNQESLSYIGINGFG